MPKAPPSLKKQSPRKAWSNNSASKRLITGRALQRERRALFDDQPLCVECLKQGRTSIATIRDHTRALAEGGADVRENTQGLCKPCSDAKTAKESQRGAKSARR